jgi:hypothetical protein
MCLAGEKPLLSEGRKELKLGLDHILLCQVPNLSALKPSVNYPNSAFVKNTKGEPTKYNKLVGPEDCIIYEHVRDSTKARTARAFLRAGVYIAPCCTMQIHAKIHSSFCYRAGY